MDVAKADKNTPRGLIQALLSTASVSRSARVTRASSRNIKTPATTEKLPTGLLKRTKRKAVGVEVATPSEDATPRTLIGRLLEVQSASSSVVANKRRRTTYQVTMTEAHTSSSTATVASVRKGVLKTPSENITPRTVIHSILKAATVESPAVHTGPINALPPMNYAAESQSDKSETSLPTILEQEDESQEEKEDKVIEAISHGKESENETEKGFNVDEDKNNELAEKDEDIATQDALSGDNDNADWLGSTQEFDQDDHESVNSDEDVRSRMSQSQQTELITVAGEEDANQSQQTELFGVRAQRKDKSRWRNLVTPHIVPRDNTTGQQLGVLSSEQECRSQKPVKRRPPTGKAPRMKNLARSDPSLPSSLVKSIFQHFSKAKVSREALELVEQGSQLFFKQMASDLTTFCQHGGRNTIETADVELLIKRQGFITDKQNLHSLIEKHLPMEYRQELIPTVQSGNTILLK